MVRIKLGKNLLQRRIFRRQRHKKLVEFYVAYVCSCRGQEIGSTTINTKANAHYDANWEQ